MKLKSKSLPALLAVFSYVYLTNSGACATFETVSMRKSLDDLLLSEKISNSQYDHIIYEIDNNKTIDNEILDSEKKEQTLAVIRPYFSHEKDTNLRLWIHEQQATDMLTVNTADRLRNLFGLGTKYDPVPANYVDNGIVKFLAKKKVSFANFNQIYNGIWGYTTGIREYALQCNHKGLNILDVTDNDMVKIQTIRMSGGNIWRDVATHDNYAYVAAQGDINSNAWVINLSQLSSSEPQYQNSKPITQENIKKFGYKDWGRTVNVWNGLLFLNDSLRGCKIFELRDDPMNPKEIITTGDGCHDSYVKTIRRKDILFSSDGNIGSWRFYDITNIRDTDFDFQSTLLGQTEKESGVYAHSSAVSDDGKTLFVFEDSNSFDMAAFNIKDINNPQLIMKFQWSGDEKFDAYAHNGIVLGKFLHVAYYSAGYRVFDISKASIGIIEEVGKLETFRDPDGDGILDNNERVKHGSWNVFVGLNSKILISDTFHGTYMVELEYPTSKECPPLRSLFKAIVKTDSNGNEVKLVVKMQQKSLMKWKTMKGPWQKGFPSNTTTTTENCLSKSRCYKVVIIDEGRDGICCNSGEGHYVLEWEDKPFKVSKFESKRSEVTKFGVC